MNRPFTTPSACWSMPCMAAISLALIASLKAMPAASEGEREGSEVIQVPGPHVSVERLMGVPTFMVDGHPMTIPCFETYHPAGRTFRQFAEAGCKVMAFNTNVTACDYGHSLPTWVDADTWDYRGFEERCDRILASDPDALILPRVNLGTPRWWLEEHPDDLEILDHGGTLYRDPNTNPTIPRDRPFPSLASETWRRDTGDALRRFIEHVQGSTYGKHMFAYILSGLDTEEWYHWSSGSNQLAGYSVHMEKAFREWLKRKYGSDEALRRGWNASDVSLDTATVPSREERWDEGKGTFRDPSKKMNVIDFYVFYNEIIPETIDYFAAIAKRATRGKKAVGAFYAYMYEFRGDPEFGHNALERYNASENLDFIFVTASYSGRQPGTGGDYSRAPARSVQLHGKLWYHDNDVVSFLAPEVMRRAGFNDGDDWTRNLKHHLDVLGYTDTPLKSRWMYRRSFGFALCHGAFESFFDLHGGHYDHPELMNEVALINRAAKKTAHFDRSSVAEILVVADEMSCAYATFRNPMLGESLLPTQFQLIKIGAPVDHVLLCDLDLLDPSPYKLVIVLNCYHIDSKDRAVLREKLLGDGRHVVWCYAAGYMSENAMDTSFMTELTGLKMAHPSTTCVAPQVAFPGDDDGLDKALRDVCGDVIGPGAAIAEPFFVSDKDAVALGRLPGSSEVSCAYKDMIAWVSIYSITPTLPAAFYRVLAERAGVHLFNDKDDTLYANASYICLHANGKGERTLKFPGRCDLIDIISEKCVGRQTSSYTRTYEDGETVILRWRRTDRDP